MASLLDSGTPLNNIGQGYAGQPNPNPPASQGGGARTWGDLLSANFGGRPIGAFWNQAFGNKPLPDQMLAQLNNQNSGMSPPQTANYAAGAAASGPPATSAYPSGIGAPSGPPATSAYPSGAGASPNPPATGIDTPPGIAAASGSVLTGAPAGGTQSQPLANPPATGGPFNYWGAQQPPMMGRGFNAGSGFGSMYGGQGRGLGTSYWARLNNIGGA